MTEIDYEALGKTMAAFVGEMNRTLNERWTTQVTRPELAAAVDLGHAEVVRHLIAALAEQGLVVVRADSYERMQAVVETAREIQRAMGERPVDITNETRWELDPVLLNVLAWNMNALDAALAAPDDDGEGR
jgi:uncharacterized membrane protein YhfC